MDNNKAGKEDGEEYQPLINGPKKKLKVVVTKLKLGPDSWLPIRG